MVCVLWPAKHRIRTTVYDRRHYPIFAADHVSGWVKRRAVPLWEQLQHYNEASPVVHWTQRPHSANDTAKAMRGRHWAAHHHAGSRDTSKVRTKSEDGAVSTGVPVSQHMTAPLRLYHLHKRVHSNLAHNQGWSHGDRGGSAVSQGQLTPALGANPMGKSETPSTPRNKNGCSLPPMRDWPPPSASFTCCRKGSNHAKLCPQTSVHRNTELQHKLIAQATVYVLNGTPVDSHGQRTYRPWRQCDAVCSSFADRRLACSTVSADSCSHVPLAECSSAYTIRTLIDNNGIGFNAIRLCKLDTRHARHGQRTRCVAAIEHSSPCRASMATPMIAISNSSQGHTCQCYVLQ